MNIVITPKRRANLLISTLATMMFFLSSLSAADSSRDEIEIKKAILQQIQKIDPSTEQMEAFKVILGEYYVERNKAARSISRTGGDWFVNVRRALRHVGTDSVKDMSRVLSPEQIKQYEQLLKITNEQFLAQIGLQHH